MPEFANDADAMLTVFNGTAHPLRNFTVSDWRQRSSASCRARCRETSDEKARGSLWWREHIKTNAKLRVSIRTDRKQLLSLYEVPGQIFQCTVDHFESFDQCAEVLIGIAERYAAGHLEANDLQRERDAQMVARGIAAPSRGKKFAANQMPRSSQQKRNRISERIQEQLVDVPDLQNIPQERISERIQGPIVDAERRTSSSAALTLDAAECQMTVFFFRTFPRKKNVRGLCVTRLPESPGSPAHGRRRLLRGRGGGVRVLRPRGAGVEAALDPVEVRVRLVVPRS